jgi:Beta-ketoacyl synthase, N-terminal domain
LRAAVQRGDTLNKLFANPGRLYVNGAGMWAPRLPGWPRAREILAGREAAPAAATGRPAPELLPPNERRRAPDTVAVALDAALAACRSAHLAPASLPCVFSSTQGDLAITDYMCTTLASTPAQLSPTRFHNSVHNAAAGYWTIAAECTRPYTALSAGEYTFGAALLEASVQALSTAQNILLVQYDIDARGPLAAVAPSQGLLSAALVLGPARGPHAFASFELALASGTLTRSSARPENAALVAGNASEACLPFMEALALGGTREIRCLAAPALGLSLQMHALRDASA